MPKRPWTELLGSFQSWYDNLPSDKKEHIIRHVINNKPRKLRDIMGLEKGARGFDLDIIDGVEGEELVDEIRHAWFAGQVEVKRDYLVSTTQNIAVEYECSGRDSGVHASEAQWIGYILDGAMYRGEIVIVMNRDRLLHIADKCRKVNGGDNEAAIMALVPVTRLVQPLPEYETQTELL